MAAGETVGYNATFTAPGPMRLALLPVGYADGLPVGPILIGGARPAHILTPSVTARGIVNMTAVAVAEAQACVLTR